MHLVLWFTPEDHFDFRFDKCFCQSCHELRKDPLYRLRGDPPRMYAVPVGWCRFGLRFVEECVNEHTKLQILTSFLQTSLFVLMLTIFPGWFCSGTLAYILLLAWMENFSKVLSGPTGGWKTKQTENSVPSLQNSALSCKIVSPLQWKSWRGRRELIVLYIIKIVNFLLCLGRTCSLANTMLDASSAPGVFKSSDLLAHQSRKIS